MVSISPATLSSFAWLGWNRAIIGQAYTLHKTHSSQFLRSLQFRCSRFYRNIACQRPLGRAFFSIKRCPRGEQRGRGDLVKKKGSSGRKLPRGFLQKQCSRHIRHILVCRSNPLRRVPRAQQPAMSGLNSIYDQAQMNKTNNTRRCLHPSSGVVGTRWGIAPLTPNQRVQRLQGDIVFSCCPPGKGN